MVTKVIIQENPYAKILTSEILLRNENFVNQLNDNSLSSYCAFEIDILIYKIKGNSEIILKFQEDLREACKTKLPKEVMKPYGVLYRTDISKKFNLMAIPSDLRVLKKILIISLTTELSKRTLKRGEEMEMISKLKGYNNDI